MRFSITLLILLYSNLNIYAQLTGHLDVSFNSKGYLYTNFMRSAAVAPSATCYHDGSVMLGSEFQNGGSKRDISLLKLTGTGIIDNNFGNNGTFTFDINNRDQYFGKSLIQDNDKIIVLGWNSRGADDDYLCLRVNKNGKLDSTFGKNGFTTFTNRSGSNDYINDAVFQSDGKIIATGETGNSNYDFSVFRLKENGSLDSTFGTNGLTTTPISSSDDIPNSILQLNDGSIMVAGYTKSSNVADFCVAKYKINGTLDSTFGLNGVLIKQLGDGVDFATTICKTNEGKILIGGFYFVAGIRSPFILKFNQNGSQDNSFGNNGFLSIKTNYYNLFLDDMAVDVNNNIVLCMHEYDNPNFISTLVLARLLPNGIFDTIFGNNGISYAQTISLNIIPNKLQLLKDNKIFVSGSISESGFKELFAARFESGIISKTNLDNKKYNFSIYQVENRIIINSDEVFSSNYSASIFNIQGQEIIINSIVIQDKIVEIILDENYMSGTYNLILFDHNKNSFYTKKIVLK